MPEAPKAHARATSRTVRAESMMGTVITVDVRDPDVGAAVVDTVFAWFREVDDTFSTFQLNSEVNRLHRGEIAERECRPEVREVLGLCAEVERRSGGCFDIHAAGRLDPSGLVKGWSVERAAAMLQAAGARNFFITAGGDLVARGEPAPGDRWRVGVRHPELADRVAAVLAVRDLAVATSGRYERGEHIVDPRTRRAPAGLLSMTVVGPSLTYADAFATAAFVMGEAGVAWVSGIDGYDALAITEDRRTVWTAGLDRLLVRATAPAA
ncbi:MAG: FAD:protein FMN transferase [Candidatus Dormibacteria bacterium]